MLKVRWTGAAGVELSLVAGPLFPVLPFINMDGFVSAVSKSFPKADILFLKPHDELVI